MAKEKISRYNPLNLISYRKIERHNFVFLAGKNIFSSLIGVFLSVSMLQAFLIEKGVTEVQLGTLNIVTNAAAIFGMLVTMAIVDRVENTKLIGLLWTSNLPALVLPLALLSLSLFGGGLSPVAVFGIVAACWACYALMMNFRSVIEIKVHRFLFSPSIYGTAFGISGVVMYVFGTGFSFGLKPLVSLQFGRLSGYGLMFVLAVVTILSYSWFSSKLKIYQSPEEEVPEESEEKMSFFKAFITCFKISQVRNIILIHFCRGVVNAMVYFLVTIGMHFYKMSLSYAAYITLVTMLANFAGFILLTILYDRIGSMWSSLLGSLLSFIGLVCLFVFHSPNLYLIGVFVFYTGHVLFIQCIPLGAYKLTPRNITGTMTVFRLILMQATEALFTFLLGLFVLRISLYLLLGFIVFATLLQTVLAIFSYKNIPSEKRPKMPKMKALHKVR